MCQQSSYFRFESTLIHFKRIASNSPRCLTADLTADRPTAGLTQIAVVFNYELNLARNR